MNTLFGISPDNGRILYSGKFNLYSVPADGSQASIQLYGSLPFHSAVSGFAFTPDSASVIYRANESAVEMKRLHRTFLIGPTPPTAALSTWGQLVLLGVLLLVSRRLSLQPTSSG